MPIAIQPTLMPTLYAHNFLKIKIIENIIFLHYDVP